jgi:2-phosphosulfolactate phosphatase
MRKIVSIDCFEFDVARRYHDWAIVAVDVVRSTTTAISAAAMGRRSYVVPTLPIAFEMAKTMHKPLLAGELAGIVPLEFEIDNSPTELVKRIDVERPLILLSSSGTRLCYEASKSNVALTACLRNYPAVAKYIERFAHVVLMGAATKGEFREEDQLCCSLIAELLLEAGYSPANAATIEIIERWKNRPVNSWLRGKSADYLRRSGKLDDLEFIANNVGDLNSVFVLRGAELVHADSPPYQFLDGHRVAARAFV